MRTVATRPPSRSKSGCGPWVTEQTFGEEKGLDLDLFCLWGSETQSEGERTTPAHLVRVYAATLRELEPCDSGAWLVYLGVTVLLPVPSSPCSIVSDIDLCLAWYMNEDLLPPD